MPDTIETVDKDQQLDFLAALKEAKEKGMYGPTSFEELDEARDAQKRASELNSILDDFSYLTYNAVYDPEIEDKVSTTRQLVNGLEARMNQVLNSTGEAIKSAISRVIGRTEATLKEDSAFFVFKDKNGKFRWIARYSNNRKDRDNPPEIISSYSHMRFVKMVDAAVIPPPRLWLWHEPSLEWGAADWVAYDDVGFAVAGGHVHEGCEEIAKAISELPVGDVRVSHGMPSWSVQYDKQDSSIITQHVTHEISPLPTYAAANLLTGFVVLEENDKGVNTMAISEKKKQEITRWGLPASEIETLESINSKDAATADELELEKKEQSEVEEAVEVVVETVETSIEEEVAPATTQAEPVSSPVAVLPDGITEILETLSKSVLAINERLEAMETKAKEYEASETERLTQKAAQTPFASMSALLSNRVIGSVVGSEASRVDGRTSLAKSTPPETEEETPSNIPFPWIAKMISEQHKKGV